MTRSPFISDKSGWPRTNIIYFFGILIVLTNSQLSNWTHIISNLILNKSKNTLKRILLNIAESPK